MIYANTFFVYEFFGNMTVVEHLSGFSVYQQNKKLMLDLRESFLTLSIGEQIKFFNRKFFYFLANIAASLNKTTESFKVHYDQDYLDGALACKLVITNSGGIVLGFLICAQVSSKGEATLTLKISKLDFKFLYEVREFFKSFFQAYSDITAYTASTVVDGLRDLLKKASFKAFDLYYILDIAEEQGFLNSGITIKLSSKPGASCLIWTPFLAVDAVDWWVKIFSDKRFIHESGKLTEGIDFKISLDYRYNYRASQVWGPYCIDTSNGKQAACQIRDILRIFCQETFDA